MISVADRKSRIRKCEQCGGKVFLYGRSIKVSIHKQNLDSLYHLKSEGHLCPLCQKFTLIFEHNGGMWD
jgi:hypothetical protein